MQTPGEESDAGAGEKASSACCLPAGRWRWAVGIFAAGAVLVLLLHEDIRLMRLRYLLIADEPQGVLKQALGGLREFGQTMAALVTMGIVATVDRRRRGIILTLLLAELLSAATYNAGKLTIARYRPYAAIDAHRAGDESDRLAVLSRIRPGDTWIGWRPVNATSATQSFPSGHTAAAVVLAATLAAFYPRLAWLLWTLAAGCALSRYLDVMHWPGDCWAGALIGYASARAAIRVHLAWSGARSEGPGCLPPPPRG